MARALKNLLMEISTRDNMLEVSQMVTVSTTGPMVHTSKVISRKA